MTISYKEDCTHSTRTNIFMLQKIGASLIIQNDALILRKMISELSNSKIMIKKLYFDARIRFVING